MKIKGTGKVTISITAKETSAYKKQTKKVTIYAVPGKRDIKKLSSGKKKQQKDGKSKVAYREILNRHRKDVFFVLQSKVG